MKEKISFEVLKMDRLVAYGWGKKEEHSRNYYDLKEERIYLSYVDEWITQIITWLVRVRMKEKHLIMISEGGRR